MRKILTILLISTISNVFAIDCNIARTTVDLNHCAEIEQKAVENNLNITYQRVLKQIEAESREENTISNKSKLKTEFINAQRYWIKFREADCQATYTHWSDGTIRGLMYSSCMKTRAEQRIKELQEYESNN